METADPSWGPLRAATACAALLTGLACVAEPHPAPQVALRADRAAAPEATTWHDLPAFVARDFFILPVELGGRPDRVLWMLYDTGAGHTVVDPDSLAEISDFSGGSGRGVRLQDVEIGPARYEEFRARTRQLDHLAAAVGFPLDGILAYGAFGDLLVQLDYPEFTMRVAEGALPEPDGVRVFRLTGRESRRPFVRLEIAGRDEEMLIDSGSGSGFAARDRGDRPWSVAPVPTRAVMGIRGPEAEPTGRLRGEAVLFGRAFPQPALRVTGGTALMGTRVLRHFTLTFAPGQHFVRAEPHRDGPVPPWPVSSTGALVVPDDGAYRVARLIAGGAAERAGLREDDRVVAIDGVPVAERGAQRPVPERRDGILTEDWTIRRGDEELVVALAHEDVVPLAAPESSHSDWPPQPRDLAAEVRATEWWMRNASAAAAGAPVTQDATSPDGARVLRTRRAGDATQILVEDGRGRLLGVIVRSGENRAPRWTADGRCITFMRPSPDGAEERWMTDAWGLAAPQPLLVSPGRETEGRWRTSSRPGR